MIVSVLTLMTNLRLSASVDPETDNKLQRMIRAEFQEATIITIAHRLETIMDSSRILVLDEVQCRHPLALAWGGNAHTHTPCTVVANRARW